MSLDGLWLQRKFCIAKVLLSPLLKPLPCLTAVLMCGHTKHDTVFKSRCPQIVNCICLWYVRSTAATLSISPITAIRQHETSVLRKMTGRGVSAVLQLLQHQVMGNMYHTGRDSRARFQLWYPLPLSCVPDKLSYSRVEHICSAAVSENQGGSRENWDMGQLAQRVIWSLA